MKTGYFKYKLISLLDFDPARYFYGKNLFNNREKKYLWYLELQHHIEWDRERFKTIEPRVKKLLKFSKVLIKN